MSLCNPSRPLPVTRPNLDFNNSEVFQTWLAQFSKTNGDSQRARGMKVIDFNTFVPNKDLTTRFPCTARLNGLLYPSPTSLYLYILEFLDAHSGKRVDITNLDIYDVGGLGDATRQLLLPQGSHGGNGRGTVDLYVLNPGSVVEISGKDGLVLKTISFTYFCGDAKPCVQ